MLIQHRHPGCDTEAAHAIRAAVFQVEQGIPSTKDYDGQDAIADQFLAFNLGQPVGTARYRRIDDRQAKVERVAVLSSQRGKKVGQAIMDAIEYAAWQQYIPSLVLDSQLTASGFYERMGYQIEGDVFEDVGIPHVKMSLNVRHPSEAVAHYGPFSEPYTYLDVYPRTVTPRTSNFGTHPMFGPSGVQL